MPTDATKRRKKKASGLGDEMNLLSTAVNEEGETL